MCHKIRYNKKFKKLELNKALFACAPLLLPAPARHFLS